MRFVSDSDCLIIHANRRKEWEKKNTRNKGGGESEELARTNADSMIYYQELLPDGNGMTEKPSFFLIIK